ncbi:MAG TPA: hypothetical protein VME24_11565, partial [Alphaproteobacteria bacterium]|nr:hypothetical protein [Alphaproteobacteria bacterium]
LDGLNVTNIQYLGQTNQIPSFGLTNIPVYMNGSYVFTPAVNRILQLAANIYDATTNTSTVVNSNYPSVFLPIFWKTNEYNAFLNERFTNVYIKGYQYVLEPLVPNSTYANAVLSPPFELTDLPFGESVSNVWGIPMIVGAKKGLPNFNGFELVSTFFIERQLQFTRNNVTPSSGIFPYGRTYTTNQQYVMGISNTFAMDNWNSYANPYNNQVTIYAQDRLGLGLTNSDNFAITNPFFTNANETLQPWTAQLFTLPFGSNVTVMQNLSFPPSPPSTNNLYTYYKSARAVTFGGIPFAGPCFIPNSLDPQNYLDPGTPPLPQFGLVETNHLQAYMLDTHQPGNFYILDSVQLGSMNNNLNINSVIADSDNNGLWSTNPYTGSITPWGVVQQFMTSYQDGTVPGEDQDGGGAGGTWAQTPVPGLPNSVNTSSGAQQAFFTAFFTANSSAVFDNITITNDLNSMQAPFTPMRQIVERYVLQANDPLVHYLTSDLTDLHDDSTNRAPIVAAGTNVTYIKYVNGQVSDRYLPWSGLTPGAFAGAPASHQLLPTTLYIGNPPQPYNVDQNQFNLAYKDPLVWSPDNWDFPGGKYPTVGWLGRVHRGTPWQSVYLKSTNIWSLAGTGNGGVSGVATWQAWTGNMNSDDAYNELPAQDRLLFDIFTAAPDDDAMRGQVSVNIGADNPTNQWTGLEPLAGLASWSALLSGTLAFASITNSQMDTQLGVYPGYQSPVSGAPWYQSAPYFNILTNQPLGASPYPPLNPLGAVSITNAALWQIVNGINSTRTNFTSIDGVHGVFEHVGDILATPQLSDGSPFLETGDAYQLNDAISDEMYEWLPQQMMGLMTVSGTPQNPPRYVVYCYGQTLKPAVNGIVTSGPFVGLCTNYQVVAESASRVVIRVDNTPTPANPTATPHVVVEQSNPLPPD